MRTRFDRQLEQLNVELIRMGALCEEAISIVAKSLLDSDLTYLPHALDLDDQIDDKEREIEALCMKILLQQQPVASDLRVVSSALKMISDMERIGDQAEDISEIALRLIDDGCAGSLEHIPQMAWATVRMVTGAVDAFVARDLDRARAVIACDDIVDDLFNQVRDDIVRLIREDGADGEEAIDLVMVAKYFERIGDHATNIAEWVVFSITGEHGNERVI